VLKAFAAKYAITYPLLSDEGSATFRRLGMLDEDLERHHAEFGIKTRDDQRGVAYPGVFLLDRNGVVVTKRFHKNYRIRDTGAGLVEAILGIPAAERGTEVGARGRVVEARLSFDSPAYRPYQRLQLTAVLTIDPGWHVYAAPVPDGYTALTLDITPASGLEVGTAEWPEPHPLRVDGLDEQFLVHEGTIRGSVPVTFAFAPGSGTQAVHARLRYQACSATECLPPEELGVDLALPEWPRAE
jgi:hypothetical protein